MQRFRRRLESNRTGFEDDSVEYSFTCVAQAPVIAAAADGWLLRLSMSIEVYAVALKYQQQHHHH